MIVMIVMIFQSCIFSHTLLVPVIKVIKGEMVQWRVFSLLETVDRRLEIALRHVAGISLNNGHALGAISLPRVASYHGRVRPEASGRHRCSCLQKQMQQSLVTALSSHMNKIRFAVMSKLLQQIFTRKKKAAGRSDGQRERLPLWY